MQIDNINLYRENILNSKAVDCKSQKVNFDKILNHEIEKNTSIIDLVKNIESGHNAKITVSSDPFSDLPIAGLNNVIIGGNTLEKMNNNSAFREKIMSIIDDWCSDSAQQERRSLAPPVKSGGIIIYPDGSYLCWLESIYSDRENEENEKISSDNAVDILKNMTTSFTENNIEQFNNLYALSTLTIPSVRVIDKDKN